jgi:aryl-alcohol dehydrogenase-like predicted oxidoreductase
MFFDDGSPVRYDVLSAAGLRVSRLCLGTALFGVAPSAADTTALVRFALDSGVNFIDTANSYGNQARFDRDGGQDAPQRASAEELIGAAIVGVPRDQIVLATKVSERVDNGPSDNGPPDDGVPDHGLSRAHIFQQIDRSLRRLQTDYIDIYHAHHPDPTTDIAETVGAFDELIRQGKIRHWALSTYGAQQLTEAVRAADQMGAARPICHQVRYNLSVRSVEAQSLPAARDFDLSTTAFGVLHGGLFAGAASRRYAGSARWGGAGFTAVELEQATRLEVLCSQWGMMPAQVAIAWALAKPTIVTAIVGPESVDEFRALVPAADLTLSADQLQSLDLLVES